MSNNDYEDDDFDTPEDNSSDSLVKQLRKANKQKEKELAELKSQFENLSNAQRDRAIKDALESRGVNTKISKFIPKDIDPTEESVSKWLEDNADLFGIQQAEPQRTTVVDPAQAAAYQKMNRAVDSGLTPDSGEDIMRKLMNANTREELDEIIRNSGL